MRNYRHNLSILVMTLTSLSVYGCSSNVEAPHDVHLNSGNNNASESETRNQREDQASQNSEAKIDFEQEALVEQHCLEAWRLHTAGNTKQALVRLQELRQKYPKSSSVFFMTGQVLEKSGNKKEAITFYEKASGNSDFAIMSLFKIAESLRTTGNTEQAIKKYKQLVAVAPAFTDAHLGLAKALMKTKNGSLEAQKELEIVAKLAPDNKEAQLLESGLKKRSTELK